MTKFSLSILSMALTATAIATPHPIKPEHELIITSPRVVNSDLAVYPGPLSFGGLLEANYGKSSAPEVARSFILSFTKPTRVNNQTIPARTKAYQKVVKPWLEKDGFEETNLFSWRPNLANAPFKLTAIVNRQDIAIANSISPTPDFSRTFVPRSSTFRRRFSTGSGTESYYGSSIPPAGELRLIYCLTNADGTPIEGGMTVIFEYDQRNLIVSNPEENPISTRRPSGQANHQVAKLWNMLSSHEKLDVGYLRDLENLVVKATTTEKQDTFRFRGGPMLRIRTNDNALGIGREFRQFNSSSGSNLSPALLSTSIHDKFYIEKSEYSKVLSNYIFGKRSLPQEVMIKNKKISTSTAHSIVLPGRENRSAWKGYRVKNSIRRNISMNSCIGCHGNETGSDGFHLAPPIDSKLPTLLSGFLANNEANNAMEDPYTQKSYSGRGELARRKYIQELFLDPDSAQDEQFAKLLTRTDLLIH